jgi:hypothetical protein
MGFFRSWFTPTEDEQHYAKSCGSRAWSKKWMLDTDQFKYLEDDPKLLFFARADF